MVWYLTTQEAMIKLIRHSPFCSSLGELDQESNKGMPQSANNVIKESSLI